MHFESSSHGSGAGYTDFLIGGSVVVGDLYDVARLIDVDLLSNRVGANVCFVGSGDFWKRNKTFQYENYNLKVLKAALSSVM